MDVRLCVGANYFRLMTGNKTDGIFTSVDRRPHFIVLLSICVAFSPRTAQINSSIQVICYQA